MQPLALLQGAFLASSGATLDCTADTFTRAIASSKASTIVNVKRFAENAAFNLPSPFGPGGKGAPGMPKGAGMPKGPKMMAPIRLPALCQVEVRVVSSENSTFSYGIFLPEKWNQRFLAVGNGGFAGSIGWADMATGVQQGFAVVSTDAGTRPASSAMGSAAWAENAPEKVTDWGWRALHESVVAGKALVKQFYSKTPTFNYYMGCSTGGRQGLKEAQMFPDDFDGIIAGAPAWWTVHLQLSNMKVGLYNLPVGAAHRIEPAMFPVIEKEVTRQCDPQDGVTDGIISDPRRCRFRPETLLCGPAASTNCLTAPQIQTLDHLYNDWVEANQTLIFPRQEYGSEWQWPMEIGNSEPSGMGTSYVKYMLNKGSSWRWQDFNPDIIKLSEEINPGNATADNFDMSPFQKKGGKLLHYHGLSDGSIVPGSSVHFYEQVYRTLQPKGINMDDFYRFYLIPGMGHCGGSSAASKAPWYIGGPNQAMQAPANVQSAEFDPKKNVLHALMQWVENGTAPGDLIASSWEGQTASKPYRQRPVCVYPKQAKYKGSGDEKLPSNWECSGLF